MLFFTVLKVNCAAVLIKVIVDMREFRSSLPSILHKKGINVIPITLEVCISQTYYGFRMTIGW